MPEQPEPSERAQLRDLSAGLLAQVRREARSGKRKVLLVAEAQPQVGAERTAPLASAPAPAAAPRPGPIRPPAPAVAAPPSASLHKEQAAGGTTEPVLSVARRAAQLALDAAHSQAREIRARAQACTDQESLGKAVAACTACSLCRTRTQTVFADGSGKVPVMFVGEAPGANEDLQGVPFVGRAGALLTDIITKGMGLRREDVTIANVLKCRPPDNRDPSDVEKILCTPWLDRQIELVNPKVLVPLGGHAAKHLLDSQAALGALRGRVHERQGRKVVPTFHPAYLLRSPGEKGECWKDIQLAMAELGLARPAANRSPSGN